MSKRIFIIVDVNDKLRPFKAAEAEQLLKEYDFDVENPCIIEEHERRRVDLGLLDEDYGWLKRDIQKVMRCDGAVALQGFTSNNYEHRLYGFLEEFPWIGENNIRFLGEWIGETDDDTVSKD